MTKIPFAFGVGVPAGSRYISLAYYDHLTCFDISITWSTWLPGYIGSILATLFWHLKPWWSWHHDLKWDMMGRVAECDVPVPGIVLFFWWYRNRYRKNLVPKKVLESVSKKFGTEKSLGIGNGKIWYRKEVSEPILENFGTGTNFCRQNLEILKI